MHSNWIKGQLPSETKDVDVALAEIKQLIQDASSIVDSTLKGAATASAIGMQKVWEAQQKKIKKAIRRQNPDKIKAISKSASRIFKKNNPQDRYMSFHHLSSHLGGFYSFRDLLLNADVPHKNATISFMHIVDENYTK